MPAAGVEAVFPLRLRGINGLAFVVERIRQHGDGIGDAVARLRVIDQTRETAAELVVPCPIDAGVLVLRNVRARGTRVGIPSRRAWLAALGRDDDDAVGG